MKMLSSEELLELRTEIAGFSLSDERKDELISFLDSITVSFVDQAFGFDSTQLSLSKRANYAFNGMKSHANLCKSEKSELVDLRSEGAINTDSPEGHFAP
jgi:hypothetical protein